MSTGTGTGLTYRESEGPDRFRHTIHCREFHDLPNEDLGGSSQCCCCNPCSHIRPYRAGGQMQCCRCVPRMLFLRFTPEDTESGCCREFYVPMVHNPQGNSPDHVSDDLVSGYVGSFFGLICYAELGRVDAGTEDPILGSGYKGCGWHITIYDGGSKLVDELYPIEWDQSDTGTGTGAGSTGDCYTVPSGIVATGIEGYTYQRPEDPEPVTCTYTVSLEQMEFARVPFKQVGEVRTFIDERPSEEDPEIITLDPAWKYITEVCSRICVAGPRHVDDSMTYKDYRTFKWFENRTEVSLPWTGTGTSGDTTEFIERGWSYYNLDTERTEYVYLEEDPPQIMVDDIEFDRAYGAYGFGNPAYPYWHGIIDTQDAYIYRADGQWALMIGGNETALGPTHPTEPYGDYVDSSSFPPVTYVVSEVTGYDPEKCYLHPRFEELAENELYEAVAIDSTRGCSTNLFETAYYSYYSGKFITFRCGFCQCWDFHCKYCRCVPKELCMTYWTADGVSDDNMLTWDGDLKGWQNETCPIRLLLVRNWNGSSKYDDQYDADVCMIIPEVTGPLGTGTGSIIGDDYEFPDGQSHWYYDCGTEAFDKTYDWETGLIRYSYIDGVNNLYIWAMSMVPECGTWPCVQGTSCENSCGGQPTKLYGVLKQQRSGAGGDDPTVYPVVEFEFELTLIKSVYQVTEEGIFVACDYIGYIPASDGCCGARISYSLGGFSIQGINQGGCIGPVWVGSGTLTEECDPYFAYGYINGNGHIWAQCLYPDWETPDDPVGGYVEITE